MMGVSAAWQGIIVEFDWGSVQADTSTGYWIVVRMPVAATAASDPSQALSTIFLPSGPLQLLLEKNGPLQLCYAMDSCLISTKLAGSRTKMVSWVIRTIFHLWTEPRIDLYASHQSDYLFVVRVSQKLPNKILLRCSQEVHTTLG